MSTVKTTVNIDELSQRIKESGLKKQFIADCLGISVFKLAQRLSGAKEFTVSEISGISSLLKLTKEERDYIFFPEVESEET